MNKEEFKARWESDDFGGGITYNDVAECAVAWGVNSYPRTSPIGHVLYRVLVAANVDDAESYNPDRQEGGEE